MPTSPDTEMFLSTDRGKHLGRLIDCRSAESAYVEHTLLIYKEEATKALENRG